MAELVREGECCECCALMVANGDDSGCRDYWEHDHPECSLPAGAFVASDGEEVWGHFTWTCEGCGQEMLAGAVRFEFGVLA